MVPYDNRPQAMIRPRLIEDANEPLINHDDLSL
jgi:hypothetical protein